MKKRQFLTSVLESAVNMRHSYAFLFAHLRRSGFVFIVALVLLQMFTGTKAMAADIYRVGIDLGNTPGTGCTFSLGTLTPASLSGFELQVTVSVDVENGPAQVVFAQIETCSNGVFGATQPLSGFSVATNGLYQILPDQIVGAVPRSFLNGAQTVRLVFHALTVDGAEDSLYSVDGTVNGAAITAAVPPALEIPTLSTAGLIVLQLCIIGAALVAWKRHRGSVLLTLICVFFASSSLQVWASFGAPIAIDSPNDATPASSRGEIISAYVDLQNPNLQLRIDVSNMETLSLFHAVPSKYVTVNLNSGQVTVDQNDAASFASRFELVREGPNTNAWAIKTAGSSKFFRYDVTNRVIADAPDLSSATKWLMFENHDGCGAGNRLWFFIESSTSTVMTFDSGLIKVLRGAYLPGEISRSENWFCARLR
jgi:hypothetical protein